MNEPETKKLFESIVPQRFFTVHRECSGQLLFRKPLKTLFIEWDKTVNPDKLRIDYVLEPTTELEKLGWELGCIGVEVKKAEKRKYGRILAQIFDYQCTKFKIPGNDTNQFLSMVFLFPYERFGGLMASIMMQEGVGVIRGSPNGRQFELLHGNGMHPILEVNENGMILCKRPRFGYRIGSR